ncbi:DUF1295 domain-containing protein [Rudaeicoccus suwonensis]|uniref:Steroid 5-alpha reductase family enzyme n=1 Tax=Rudaeicoccus suwonensis TaxID=657409 RepID=A0A561E133_9MICO|nr:DUF1295 domain-containing protein [Rudaeicoccus suwonensis]TWE09314.1 steroid 5-alpha reductase family enzyme [Rudaeicoccus suwonensis]
MTDFLWLTVGSAVVLAVLQVVTFAVSRRVGRWSVVDVIWGPGFALVAIVGLCFGSGGIGRRSLLAVLVTIWGCRLGWHIFQRSRGGADDARYVKLAEGRSVAAVAVRVFLTQGVLQWFISLPLQVVAVTSDPHGLGIILTVVGAAIVVGGLIIEAVADRQLAAYKRMDPRPQVMDQGLWGWSRHPNYFGDACVWTGIYLVAVTAWPGALTVLSSALMVWLLVAGSGARLLERHMSQRPGYSEYRERTSLFVPLPPKKRAAEQS